MSKRDPEILFDDITEAIERINDYIGDYSCDDFKRATSRSKIPDFYNNR